MELFLSKVVALQGGGIHSIEVVPFGIGKFSADICTSRKISEDFLVEDVEYFGYRGVRMIVDDKN